MCIYYYRHAFTLSIHRKIEQRKKETFRHSSRAPEKMDMTRLLSGIGKRYRICGSRCDTDYGKSLYSQGKSCRCIDLHTVSCDVVNFKRYCLQLFIKNTGRFQNSQTLPCRIYVFQRNNNFFPAFNTNCG